jgi:hypothetical protein
VVLCPDVAPYSDSRFDCRDLLQRSVIHYAAARKASSAIISAPIQAQRLELSRVYLAALPKIEAPALSPFRPGLLYWPPQLAAFWRGSLKFAIRVARVTSSAAPIFGFHSKTGMSRLFRTYRAPLSQCAMM